MTPQRAHDVFPGPRPFEPEESGLFFGRERETADLRDLALSYQALLLYSRSGAGKTSLVNASLIPVLQAAGFSVMRARVAGTDVPEDLRRAEGFNIFAYHVVGVAAGRRTLADLLAPEGQPPVYAIFDQFEELFTAYPDRWQDRGPFFAQLREALRRNENLHLLFVIREDYIAGLDPFSDSLPGGFRFRYRLERLRAEQAERAIRCPLEQAGVRFASADLAGEVVRELTKERIQTESGASREIAGEFVEPLHLQIVCRRLLGSLPPGSAQITRHSLNALGNIDDALKDYYHAAVRRAARGSQARLRNWIERRLVTPSGTRAFAYLGAAAAGVPDAVVRALAAERVIHIEQRAGAEWVELTHDRFIQPIKRANEEWRRPRRNRVIMAAVISVAVLLVAPVLWLAPRGESNNAAVAEARREAGQFRTLLAAGGANDQELSERIEAHSRLTRMDLARCSAVTVEFAARTAPTEELAQTLQSAWREMGFTVVRTSVPRVALDPDRRPVTNAVTYGSGVPPPCWRAVACVLIRAGILVRSIEVSRSISGRPSIRVGHSDAARNAEPYTVQRLWAE